MKRDCLRYKRCLSLLLAVLLTFADLPLGVVAQEAVEQIPATSQEEIAEATEITEAAEVTESTEATEETAAQEMGPAAAAEAGDDLTIYVNNETGDNSSSGAVPEQAVSSLSKAYRLLDDRMQAAGLAEDPSAVGRIVLTGDVSFLTTTGPMPEGMDHHDYTIVLSGITQDVRLRLASNFNQLGPTVYENLTIQKLEGATHTFLIGNGYPVTIGENIATIPNAEGYYLTIIGGKYDQAHTGNTEVTIRSGTWRNVYAGGYLAALIGDISLKILGGSIDTAIGASYNGAHIGNFDCRISGAEVNRLSGGNNAGNVENMGNVSIRVSDGAVVHGIVNAGGVSGVQGDIQLFFSDCTIYEEITAKCTGTVYTTLEAAEGQVLQLHKGSCRADAFLGGGTLILSDKASLYAASVTGMTDLQILGVPLNAIPYITAPAEVPDTAFSYLPQGAESLVVSGEDSKTWMIENGQDPTGLHIRVPEGVELKLYKGFRKSGDPVTPSRDTLEAGWRTYTYFALPSGNYSYACGGSGINQLIQNLYYSQEKAASNLVLEVDPGTNSGEGFAPGGSFTGYTQEVMDNLLPSDIFQWPEYADIFEIPFLTNRTSGHQMTTQQEMMAFLRNLDAQCQDMYLFVIGTSPSYGYEIPLAVFSETDLSSAGTLEEAAALLEENGLLTIQYQAQIHANEPAGGDAALALAQRLCGDYGSSVLGCANVCILPRINPDGAYRYQRYNVANSIDMNRDHMRMASREVTLVHRVYNLFQPEVVIDAHEFALNNWGAASGTLDDVQIAPASHLYVSEEMQQLVTAMVEEGFQAARDNDLRPFFYESGGKYISSANYAIGREYYGLAGSLSVLVETNGLGCGALWYPRRLAAQYVAAEAMIDYAVENAAEIQNAVFLSRLETADAGAVYDLEDLLILEHGSDMVRVYMDRPTWNFTDGTTLNAGAQGYMYEKNLANRTTTRPTAYVIPKGEDWALEVVSLMEKHGIRYYTVAPDTAILLQQYAPNGTAGDGLTKEQSVTFSQGAYVFPMDQRMGNVLAMLMEPEVTDTAGYNGTLVQSGLIQPGEDGKLPIYRYIHDLVDGKVETENTHVHSYESVVTAPTCNAQGYTTYTCACGDNYADFYVAALGHSFVDWKAIAEDTREGLCGECGETEVLTRMLLPASYWGTVYVEQSASAVYAGTANVAAVLGLKEGTFSQDGVTVTVAGTTVTASGTPSKNLYFDLQTGTFGVPDYSRDPGYHLPDGSYRFGLFGEGTLAPTVCIRSLDGSGNLMAVGHASGIALHTDLSGEDFGIPYLYFPKEKAYDYSGSLVLNPSGNSLYDSQISRVEKVVNGDTAVAEGFLWSADPGAAVFGSRQQSQSKESRLVYTAGGKEYIRIYLPREKGYLQIRMNLTDSPSTNAYGWRLDMMYACDDQLRELFPVTNTGEYEAAIMLQDRPDFMGMGAHGSERMTSFAICVNGAEVALEELKNLTAWDSIRIVRESDLYDPADETTVVATHYVQYDFDREGLTVTQSVKWLTDGTCTSSYMMMFPVRRLYNTLQITDTYTDDHDPGEYDVSQPGFTTYPMQWTQGPGKMTLYSEKSGVTATMMRVMSTGLTGGGYKHCSPSESYNKLYFTICGGKGSVHNVYAGDVWETKTRYEVTIAQGAEVEDGCVNGHTLAADAGREPTCTQNGLTAGEHCIICNQVLVKQEVIAALGHKWQDADAEIRECTACGYVEGGYRLSVESEEVWIDGVKQRLYSDETGTFVQLPGTDAGTMVVYGYNDAGAEDPHTQYPTMMQVWRLKFENGGYIATYLPEFENLLQYSGSSIRVTGVKGIRMITAIDKALRSQLISGSLGYTLVEYGTCVAWASDLNGAAPVLGQGSTLYNYAYKKDVADPIFADTGDSIQYTNVLVGFTDDQLADDLVMRPYMILEDAAGEQITLYGGCVQRSIGYIAKQNQEAFPEGSKADAYIEDIISKVYG